MTESEQNNRPPRIVIVNDEPFMLQSLEMMIRFWFKDAKIMAFCDPKSALLELLQSDPDLLITDDTMPKMSGFELIERLADRCVAYPIMLTSCWDEPKQWLQEWAIYGLNISYFPMPCDLEQFKEALTKHVGPRTRD